MPKATQKNDSTKRTGNRQQPASRSTLHIGKLEIDLSLATVSLNGKKVNLRRKEFEMLACLVHHRGATVTRQQLLKEVWGGHILVGGRTIDVHIRKVREKLGAYAEHIETVKGEGYRFRKT